MGHYYHIRHQGGLPACAPATRMPVLPRAELPCSAPCVLRAPLPSAAGPVHLRVPGVPGVPPAGLRQHAAWWLLLVGGGGPMRDSGIREY